MGDVLPLAALLGTVLLPQPANLKPVDQSMYYGSNLGLVGDWVQTRRIAEGAPHPEGGNIMEMNPVLGKEPSTQDVDLWFASSYLANQLVSRKAPPAIRRAWWLTLVALQGAMIQRNRKLGLQMKFEF